MLRNKVITVFSSLSKFYKLTAKKYEIMLTVNYSTNTEMLNSC